jgi:hypothetical protein
LPLSFSGVATLKCILGDMATFGGADDMADPITLPSVADQFAAALSAPLPFVIAVGVAVAVAVGVIWRAFEWRYAGVIEKTSSLWKLAEHDVAAAKKREAELKETVEQLTNELNESKKDAELADKLVKIEKVAAKAATQVQELRDANNAISETVSRGVAASAGTAIIIDRGTVIDITRR